MATRLVPEMPPPGSRELRPAGARPRLAETFDLVELRLRRALRERLILTPTPREDRIAAA